MEQAKDHFTYEEVRAFLTYYPDTGKLFYNKVGVEWFQHCKNPKLGCAVFNSKCAGREGFTHLSQGYNRTTFRGRLTLAHRVIWLWMTGEHAGEINHINRNRSDNRWENLESADRKNNMLNKSIYKSNTSGISGVVWNKQNKKWRVQIFRDGKFYNGGLFEDKEDATNKAREMYHQIGFAEEHGT